MVTKHCYKISRLTVITKDVVGAGGFFTFRSFYEVQMQQVHLPIDDYEK